MNLQYFYDKDKYVQISLKKVQGAPNYIWIEFSAGFEKLFSAIELEAKRRHEHIGPILDWMKKEVDDFFCDNSEVVYIPAGRSTITLLSTQMNYIYSFMDDVQKRSLDYCTKNYLERILQLKSAFTVSPW